MSSEVQSQHSSVSFFDSAEAAHEVFSERTFNKVVEAV